MGKNDTTEFNVFVVLEGQVPKRNDIIVIAGAFCSILMKKTELTPATKLKNRTVCQMFVLIAVLDWVELSTMGSLSEDMLEKKHVWK